MDGVCFGIVNKLDIELSIVESERRHDFARHVRHAILRGSGHGRRIFETLKGNRIREHDRIHHADYMHLATADVAVEGGLNALQQAFAKEVIGSQEVPRIFVEENLKRVKKRSRTCPPILDFLQVTSAFDRLCADREK